MEEEKMKVNNEKVNSSSVLNNTLFNSYVVYLVAVIAGLLFDNIFNIDLFGKSVHQNIGLAMVVVGTILIYWAQSTTRKLKKIGDKTPNFFFHGPYRIMRNPTNSGITLMCLGLGFILNSLFSVLFVFVAYLASRFVYIKKQDLILEKKYGEEFLEYKKEVKNWL